MQNTLFVTGTDTGVGKTVVTAVLALKIRQMGMDCGVYKPFASGCELKNGVLESDDARFLQKWASPADSMDEICPIRLEEPLAPLIAARRAHLSTRNWRRIAWEGLEHLREKHEFVVIEGVGGLLAPIWESEGGFGSNLDLIRAWNLPAVLVARRTLGTINHTLLTLRAAPFQGLVFNDANPIAEDDIAAQTGPPFITEVADTSVWGHLPFALEITHEFLDVAAQSLNLPPF